MPKMKLLSLDMWRVNTLSEDMGFLFHDSDKIARDQERLEAGKNPYPDVFSDNCIKLKQEEDLSDEIIF
jgi:hypothetical protein